MKNRVIKIIIALIIFLAMLTIVLINPANPLDYAIRDFFYSIRIKPLNKIFTIYTNLCDAYVIIPLLIGLLLVFKKNLYRIIITCNIAFAFVLNNIIKLLVNRERPLVEMQLVSESSSSFPSGHSMNGIAFYLMLFYIISLNVENEKTRKSLIFVGYFIGCFLVISRLYLGVHYFTDTIAGFSLGYAICNFMMIILDKYLAKDTK